MKDAEDKNNLPSMGLGTMKAPGCGAKELGLCD